MAVRKGDLVKWIGQLEALKGDVPAVMDKIAVGEGTYAVKQAKQICTEDVPDIVNTGEYRRNWHSDKKARRSGRKYIVRFFNSMDYAGHIEYGFRSHFVPGHWDGNSFVYQRNDPQGGMFVGPKSGYVRGRYTMKRATKETLKNQASRVGRKVEKEIKQRIM